MVNIKNLAIYNSIMQYINIVEDQMEIEKVYLFGSFAKQNSNLDSDIDIAIISPSLSGNRFNDNLLLGKLTWNVDTRIEPVGFTPENISKSILGQEILSTGIEIDISDVKVN